MQGGVSPAAPAREAFPPTWLETEGRHVDTGAHVTAAVALGDTGVSAHGDGVLRLLSGDAPPREVTAHRGVVLAMAAAGRAGVVTGGDDGRLLRITTDGEVEELADFGRGWVDCVATHGEAGLVACSIGRAVHVWRPGAARPATFEHPSTVGGLAFDPKGKRLAVAHYGGATVWERGERRWTSTKLKWAGSHIGVTWSPNGKYVITVMQENALHGWRLRDKLDMRMSGYPAKPRALDWVGDGPHLATSGAGSAVCWPFHLKDGPMGQAPLCVAHGGQQLATMVRGLPGQAAVLAGYQDGAVLLSELDDDAEAFVLRGTTGIEVTALTVTESLSHILIGDAAGGILWAPLRIGDGHARPV
jgi:WD40 repeat protein